MAKDFHVSEPTVRILFSPDHFTEEGELQLNAFGEYPGNDVSLVRYIISGKNLIIWQATLIATRKQKKNPDFKYKGICLLCTQKVMQLSVALYSIKIVATPDNQKWNEERKAFGGTETRSISSHFNASHASFWIVESGNLPNFAPDEAINQPAINYSRI